jgi:hypothetical protein
MRCDVSTLPPQTAAVRDGDNRLSLGMRTATKLNKNAVANREALTVERDQATSIQRDIDVEHGTYAIYHC